LGLKGFVVVVVVVVVEEQNLWYLSAMQQAMLLQLWNLQ